MEYSEDYFPLRVSRATNDGPKEIEIVCECGPLHGERITEVPAGAVYFSRALDDGTVVSYKRWKDNVWRYDRGELA